MQLWEKQEVQFCSKYYLGCLKNLNIHNLTLRTSFISHFVFINQRIELFFSKGKVATNFFFLSEANLNHFKIRSFLPRCSSFSIRHFIMITNVILQHLKERQKKESRAHYFWVCLNLCSFKKITTSNYYFDFFRYKNLGDNEVWSSY